MANPFFWGNLGRDIGQAGQTYLNTRLSIADMVRQMEDRKRQQEMEQIRLRLAEAQEKRLADEAADAKAWREGWLDREKQKASLPMSLEDAIDRANDVAATGGGRAGQNALATYFEHGRVNTPLPTLLPGNALDPQVMSQGGYGSWMRSPQGTPAPQVTPMGYAQSVIPGQTPGEIKAEDISARAKAELEQKQRSKMAEALKSVNADISRALQAGGSANAQALLPGILDNARLSVQLVGGDALTSEDEMKLTEYIGRRLGTKFGQTPTEKNINSQIQYRGGMLGVAKDRVKLGYAGLELRRDQIASQDEQAWARIRNDVARTEVYRKSVQNAADRINKKGTMTLKEAEGLMGKYSGIIARDTKMLQDPIVALEDNQRKHFEDEISAYQGLMDELQPVLTKLRAGIRSDIGVEPPNGGGSAGRKADVKTDNLVRKAMTQGRADKQIIDALVADGWSRGKAAAKVKWLRGESKRKK